MRVDDFEFELPPDCIALRPSEPRDASKLLVVKPGASGQLFDHRFSDLPKLLQPGDVMVFNDTRVIPARLFGQRWGRGETTPRIEVTLHLRDGPARWHAFARPARKLDVGDRVRFGPGGDVGADELLEATVAEKLDAGEIVLEFDHAGAVLDEVVAKVGEMPLPPYIASKRSVDGQDQLDYQTVYAAEPGAVAAPTAGLHFTQQLLDGLDAAGVERATVTLHVGAGTFLPVKSDTTEEHRMHSEWGTINEATAAHLNRVKSSGGRIIAVGTTSLRLLESAADENGQIQPFAAATDIFITPGYKFRAVDLLVTNFHLPRSTLFMLVCAFSGMPAMRAAYSHAIETGYRFYSYGDASLLARGNGT